MNSETINQLNRYRQMGYEDICMGFADSVAAQGEQKARDEYVREESERISQLYRQIAQTIIDHHSHADFENIILGCKVVMDREGGSVIMIVGDIVFDGHDSNPQAKAVAESVQLAVRRQEIEAKTVFKHQEIIWALDFALKSLTDWEFAEDQIVLVRRV